MIRVDESDPVGGKRMRKRGRISVAKGFRGLGVQVSRCFSEESFVEEHAGSAFRENTKSARTSRMARIIQPATISFTYMYVLFINHVAVTVHEPLPDPKSIHLTFNSGNIETYIYAQITAPPLPRINI